MNTEVPPSHSLEATVHLAQARSNYEKTEGLDQALLECDIAIQIDPSLTTAHNLRGIVLEKLGRKAEALAAYKQALELDPGFHEAKENLAVLEDKLALLPRWLRNGLIWILVFLLMTYILELYLSKNHFLIWERLLVVVLVALYTPGIVVQFLLGHTGLELEIFNWTIRIVSSLIFGYIGGAIALKRKRILRFIAISLLPLYLVFFGAWYLLFWIASSFY